MPIRPKPRPDMRNPTGDDIKKVRLARTPDGVAVEVLFDLVSVDGEVTQQGRFAIVLEENAPGLGGLMTALAARINARLTGESGEWEDVP